MSMHAEDARRNGWAGKDGLREGGRKGEGERESEIAIAMCSNNDMATSIFSYFDI